MSRKQESLRQGTSAAREDQRPPVRLPESITVTAASCAQKRTSSLSSNLSALGDNGGSKKWRRGSPRGWRRRPFPDALFTSLNRSTFPSKTLLGHHCNSGQNCQTTLASVTGKVTCDLLGVARVVTRVWVVGVVGRVLFVVTGEVVARTSMVVFVVRVSELDVLATV